MQPRTHAGRVQSGFAARPQEVSSLTAGDPPSLRGSAGKGPRVQWKGGLHKSWLRYTYTGFWSRLLRNKLAAARVWSGPPERRVEPLSEDTLSGYCSYHFGAHLHRATFTLAVGEKSLQNVVVLSVCISSMEPSHYLKLVLAIDTSSIFNLCPDRPSTVIYPKPSFRLQSANLLVADQFFWNAI